MSIHPNCDDELHELDVYAVLDRMAQLLDVAGYYTRTGDTDGAALRACLYAQALWLVDRAPGPPEQPEEPIGEHPDLFYESMKKAMGEGGGA